MKIPVDINAQVTQAYAAFGESKNTRGKSRYTRKAMVKVMNLSPEDFAKFKPTNGWETAAANQRRLAEKDNGNACKALELVMKVTGEHPELKKQEDEDETPAAVAPFRLSTTN